MYVLHPKPSKCLRKKILADSEHFPWGGAKHLVISAPDGMAPDAGPGWLQPALLPRAIPSAQRLGTVPFICSFNSIS